LGSRIEFGGPVKPDSQEILVGFPRTTSSDCQTQQPDLPADPISHIRHLPQGYGKLLQLYGVHKATMEARKKGLSVLRRQQQNGAIKLVLMGVGT
jgi:uncharacterized protein (DUF2384 family)